MSIASKSDYSKEIKGFEGALLAVKGIFHKPRPTSPQ